MAYPEIVKAITRKLASEYRVSIMIKLPGLPTVKLREESLKEFVAILRAHRSLAMIDRYMGTLRAKIQGNLKDFCFEPGHEPLDTPEDPEVPNGQ